jgi:hypothetical protein
MSNECNRSVGVYVALSYSAKFPSLSLTPCSRALLEKIIVIAFYGIQKFITAFTIACHLSTT